MSTLTIDGITVHGPTESLLILWDTAEAMLRQLDPGQRQLLAIPGDIDGAVRTEFVSLHQGTTMTASLETDESTPKGFHQHFAEIYNTNVQTVQETIIEEQA